jgi:riboflavin synthase
MFTGLISEVGRIERLVRRGGSGRLIIAAPRTAAGVKPGDSVATAGACLTVESIAADRLTCAVIAETLAATRLGQLKPGDRVNLELAVGPEDVFGGHLVAGHIDTVGRIHRTQRIGEGGRLTVTFPTTFDRWVIAKGSIALEGISLTIAELHPGQVTVGIIPTTWVETTISSLNVGDQVNIEFDQTIKAVTRKEPAHSRPAGLSEQDLHRAGW